MRVENETKIETNQTAENMTLSDALKEKYESKTSTGINNSEKMYSEWSHALNKLNRS